jgi:AbrB family looped-hinge helix DNA binding protein
MVYYAKRRREMYTCTVTSKGQIVIPSQIRKRLNIKSGTKLCMQDTGFEINMRPVTSDYLDAVAGILKSKKNLAHVLLEERAAEYGREKKK